MRQLEWKTSRPARRKPRGFLMAGVAANWPRLLTILFSGLFLVSFIHWFGEEDGGFLPKTILLLYSTLAIVFVTEAAAIQNRYLQRVIQLLILLAFHAIALDYTPVWAQPENVRELGRLLLYNAEQLFPYCWFSLGAWVIYLATVWWMGNKKRIVAALVAGVLAMALRDSFSLMYLWDEAAWLILCGLFLLVIRQFSTLRGKSPEGWGYIADYPLSFIAPIVLLLTATVGAGTLAPDVTNVLTDPYTLYKKWEGEPVTLPGKISEIASPILPNAGESVSGYSRNDSSLGGGFDYNYASVFKVETNYRSYWRGQTKAIYTGTGWVELGSQEDGRVEIAGAGKELSGDPGLDTSKRKTVEVKQTVTFLEKSPKYPVLFGAYQLESLDSVNGKNEFAPVVWRASSSALEWGKGTYPKTYTIVSEMPVLDEAGLRAAPADYPEKARLAVYLDLSAGIPERVQSLAREITMDATNPYDKAKAIEHYLQTTYPYTNTPKDSKNSKDFVDRFLFETKEGYCDYYSTAMAVMGRVVGLPTRWVKGYAAGSSPLDDMSEQDIMSRFMERDPNGAGTYTVHNSDAHSWVEVYFSGYGWIPFDPTAGFSVPYASDPAQKAQDPVAEQTPADPAAANPAQAESPDRTGLWAAAAAVLLLAAAAGVWYLAGYRRGRWIPQRLAIRSGKHAEANYNRQLIKEFEKLLRYFRRRGFPVLEHETARETLRRWREKDAWLTQDLDRLIVLFEKAKYSPAPVTEEEAARAAGIVHKLRKER